MRSSLVFVLLHCCKHARGLQSEQHKSTSLRNTEGDANWVDLNLCTDGVHANLGGLGGVNVGETGPEDKTADGKWKKELRYKNVAKLPTGEKLDLVVTNLTEYISNPINPKPAALLPESAAVGEDSGTKHGCLGSINIKAPGKVQLKFSLMLRGTDTPAPNNYTYDFTILDFDRSKYGMYEEVSTHRFASYFSQSIKPTVVGEQYRFASSADAVEVPNPEEGYKLTEEQLQASVGLVFAHVNHWKLDFKAVDSPDGIRELEVGRNIFFAGRTSLQSKGKPQKVHSAW